MLESPAGKQSMEETDKTINEDLFVLVIPTRLRVDAVQMKYDG